MEKKPLQSKPLRLLKDERWRPYIRYEKETDAWITKAIKEVKAGREEMEETVGRTLSKIKILMDREQLDIIARIVAYMYHDKIDSLKTTATDLRKEHIYKDLRSIDQWLNIQYQQMQDKDDRNEKLNKIDLEIINEQSK